jgi:hypothetical protein
VILAVILAVISSGVFKIQITTKTTTRITSSPESPWDPAASVARSSSPLRFLGNEQQLIPRLRIASESPALAPLEEDPA